MEFEVTSTGLPALDHTAEQTTKVKRDLKQSKVVRPSKEPPL
jgi:hypothetical protein